MVQWLRGEVLSEQWIAKELYAFWFGISQDCDAQGMLEVVRCMEGRLHVKTELFGWIQGLDAIAPQGSDVPFVSVPAEQIPTVAVFFEEVGIHVVGRHRGVVRKLLVAQLYSMLGPNGVKQRREMFRSFGVWRAFKLNVLLHAFRVQVGRHGKAVRNFSQGLVELLKNGQVPELDQGVGGEPDGVEVVLVELDVVDAVSVFGVVVAPFITMVFDGSVVAQFGFVAHRPQVLLNGGDADAFTVAAVEGLFTGQTQRFFGWEGVAWVGQAAVNDAVP